MASTYRCPRGHRWAPPATAGDNPSCPECGATPPAAGAFGRAEVPPHVLAAATAGGAPGGEATTGLFQSAPAADVAPSFASLVGVPPTDDSTRVGPVSGAYAPIPMPSVPGYDVVCEIGRGGMGVVYRARQLALNRTVALKMILSGAHAGPAERDRFRREAEAAAALQHPHIVQIFEIGEAAGHPYLALEIVEGGSLAQRLDGSPWPSAEAAGLIEVLARAMHFAHERGIVHRDLKPGNVLLEGVRIAGGAKGKGRGTTGEAMGDVGAEGATAPRKARRGVRAPAEALVPKIADFGLAKRIDERAGSHDGTRTGAVLGTPSYIAPEQASGKGRDIGPATDVYALGAVLYELLTGRPPFRGETPLDTVLLVLRDDPVSPRQLQPKVPRDLETICLKCLSKAPARRYPTALGLAADLRRFLDGEPIRARPLSAWGRAAKWAGRHPALAALAAVTATAVVAVVSVLAVAYDRVRDAVAQREAETLAANVARDLARQLARDNEAARHEAERQSERLRQEGERFRRAAYALQLAQVAALVERDPFRAGQMLEDENRCPSSLRDFTWHYLHRLCRREERKYVGNGGEALHAVAVSPDGRLVATGGKDNVVHLWDPRTGATLAVLTGHAKWITGVAFRPDGRAVAASGADGTVRLWPVPVAVLGLIRQDPWVVVLARRIIQPIDVRSAVTLEEAHEGSANAVAFAPDGRTLATGGQDGLVRLWELGRWRAAAPDATLAGGAGATAWAAEHDRANPTARPVWELRPLAGHARAVLCLSFAAGGRLLASGSADGNVRVWAADGSALVRDLSPQADEPTFAVALTPDGKRLAAANNANAPGILLWDTETWAAPRRLVGPKYAVHALAAGPENVLLASAEYDGTVRLWDLEVGRERSVLLGHAQRVPSLAFSPDRRTLLSAGTDGTARVWQVALRGYDAVEVERDGEQLAAAAVSENGETLAAGGPEKTVRVWALDAAPGGRRVPDDVQVRGVLPAVPLIEYELPSRAMAVAVSRDGTTVLAGCSEGVYVWRLTRARPDDRPDGRSRVLVPVRKPQLIAVPRPVYGLALDPAGNALAVVCDDGVRLWDLRSMLPLETARPGGRAVDGADVRDVAFGPRGGRLAVAAGESLRIVDAASSAVVAEAPVAHGGATVEAVALSPNGRTAATADATGLVKLWQLDGSGAATVLAERATLTAHTEAVHTLAFSPDGRVLVSGGWDRRVVLWDSVTGQERASLPDHADRVLRVQFAADGEALMTAGRDGQVKRWRAGRPR